MPLVPQQLKICSKNVYEQSSSGYNRIISGYKSGYKYKIGVAVPNNSRYCLVIDV